MKKIILKKVVMSLKKFVSYWKVYKQNHEIWTLFLSKTLKVKIDKKFLLNSELLSGFSLIFCCLVMKKFLITFSYFKIENFINNIHI